jgi:hypothetical protein
VDADENKEQRVRQEAIGVEAIARHRAFTHCPVAPVGLRQDGGHGDSGSDDINVGFIVEGLGGGRHRSVKKHMLQVLSNASPTLMNPPISNIIAAGILPSKFIWAAVHFNAKNDNWKASIEPNPSDFNYVGIVIRNTMLELKKYTMPLLIHIQTTDEDISNLMDTTLKVLIAGKETDEKFEKIAQEAQEEGIPNEYTCAMM